MYVRLRATTGTTGDLAEYAAADMTRDAGFDRLTRLAAGLFAAPVAFVTLLDGDRFWLQARVGLEADEAPETTAFCAHVIRTRSTLVVPDARADRRFADNLDVTGRLGLRFYAGAPLLTPDGLAIGTVCVVDRVPRPPLWPADRVLLEDVALLVRDRLDLRREARRSTARAVRADLLERLLAIVAEAPDFTGALTEVARVLWEATGGKRCHVWRLAGEGGPPVLAAVSGSGVFAGADYADMLRGMVLTPQNSQICEALLSGEQVISRTLRGVDADTRRLYAFSAAHGIVAQISTPFSLLGERYAFAVGLGPDVVDVDAVAALLLDVTTALRPLLRRHLDEAATRLFRRAVDASSEPVFITEAQPLDAAGPLITYVNPAFAAQTGYAAADLVGARPRVLHGPLTSATALTNLRAAQAALRPACQELLIYRRDGTPRSIELNIAPVMHPGGGCTHFVGMQRDVTERNAVERLRLDAARELETLLSVMAGALTRLGPAEDGGWITTYATPSIQKLTGYTPAEARLGLLRGAVHAADLPGLREQMRQAVDADCRTIDFGFRHRDGRDRRFRGHFCANQRLDGTREMIMSWTDITREHEMTEHLAQTAKLAQLGEVATGIAHELNQPLAGISLTAENALRALARGREGVPRVRQKLELIVEQALRASAVIDHMRAFGRIGLGASGPVAMAGVVGAATRLLQAKLRAGGVTLKVDVPEHLPSVIGKQVPLEQVMINLIANACDAYVGLEPAVPAASRVVAVAAEAVGDTVRLRVQDQAGGIPPAVLPHIFEPFFTTKVAGQGTGLGLSISHGIVTDLGGTLAVASSDLGSIFTIVLPAAPSA